MTIPIGLKVYTYCMSLQKHAGLNCRNFSKNPGVVDNSGMRFYYTTEQPAQEAGALSLGHDVVGSMIVPPGATNFTITGVCPADCTKVLQSYSIKNAIVSQLWHCRLFLQRG